MYNFASLKQAVSEQPMEAEQLNQIANRLSDLAERHHALRGYL
jgi:hypothetical protein